MRCTVAALQRCSVAALQRLRRGEKVGGMNNKKAQGVNPVLCYVALSGFISDYFIVLMAVPSANRVMTRPLAFLPTF